MAAAETVEVYVQDMETLRVILMLGFVLLGGWWAAQLRAERPDVPKKAPYELCKLHSRPTHECRDQHDKEGPK